MKKDAEKDLYLFTSRYPGGDAESFIEPELHEIAAYYKTVHIFPLLEAKENPARRLPPNVRIHRAFTPGKTGIRKIKPVLAGILLREWASCKKKWRFLTNIRAEIRRLAQCYERSLLLRQTTGQGLFEADLYCFWMEDWATTLSFIKKRHPKLKFTCRVHGYDLYPERRPEGYMPFRRFQITYTSAVVCVSDAGYRYLSSVYPSCREKFFVSRLGTNDPGILNEGGNGEIYVLVSCAGLVPLKRIDLLARHLLRTNIPVKWIHFGDGPEKEKVKAIMDASANPLLNVEFKGRVDRSDILRFYAGNPVDVFIHMSETEGGVPLAIQEALSYGIPAMGCNAGGVGEIVNDVTGRLIPVIHSDAEFDHAIHSLLRLARNRSFRQAAREHWKKGFSIAESTRQFVGLLSGNRS